VRIELVCNRNTAYLSAFESVRNINFVPKSPFEGIGRSTIALVRESLMLEARESSTLLSIVN
jgi:hypothetical protein